MFFPVFVTCGIFVFEMPFKAGERAQMFKARLTSKNIKYIFQ